MCVKGNHDTTKGVGGGGGDEKVGTSLGRWYEGSRRG